MRVTGMFGYSILRAGQNREFFQSILSNMRKFNVPIEGLHTETGPGVYEAAILFSDALEAADRGVLFKASVKELGHMLVCLSLVPKLILIEHRALCLHSWPSPMLLCPDVQVICTKT